MMHLSVNIFVLLTLFASCRCTGDDYPKISFLGTSISTPGVKVSQQPAANLNSINTISSKIKFYVSAKARPRKTSLTIEVTLPFKNSTRLPYEKFKFQYEKTFIYTPRVQLLDKSLQVQLYADGILVRRGNYNFKKKNSYSYIVTIPKEVIPVHTNFIIECSYKAKAPSSVSEVGSLLKFKLRAALGSVSKNNSVTLKIVGPRLSITTDPPNIIMDAGQERNVKFMITTHPFSTSNPCDLKISAGRSPSPDFEVSEVRGANLLPFPLRATWLGPLRRGDRMEIAARLKLGSRAHIGHALEVPFSAVLSECNKPGRRLLQNVTVQVAQVRDISDMMSSIDVPDELNSETTVPLEIGFKIPKGLLPSFSLVLETETDAGTVRSILTRRSIVLHPSLMTPHPRLLNFDSSHLRRRRSAGPQHEMQPPAVTIFHPADSNEPSAFVKLEGEIGARLEDEPHPASVTLQVSVMYGKRRRVVRSVILPFFPVVSFFRQLIFKDNKGVNDMPRFLVIVTVNMYNNVTNSSLQEDIRGLHVSRPSITCAVNNMSRLNFNTVAEFHTNDSSCTNYVLTYEAEVSSQNTKSTFSPGINWISSTLRYYYNNIPGRIRRFSCIRRKDEVNYKDEAQYGWIFLLIFIGFLVGLLLLLLLGILYVKFINTDVNPFELDDLSNEEERVAMQETETLLLMSETGKGDMSTITGLSVMQGTDSIVGIIINKNRNQIYRDLDNLDVLASIHIDLGLETRYMTVSGDALLLLLQNLTRHGTLSSDVVSKATQSFQKNLETLDKEITAAHKKESSKVMKKIGKKNKREMQQLLGEQRKERENLEEDLQNEREEERVEILDMQKKEHKAQRDNLVYKLKLQQDEASEQLRKKYALQRRGMAGQLQRHLLDEVKSRSRLDPAQADWLLAEHRRIQQHLDARYDAEVARQRVLLEEKLERRRALARRKELEEENQTEMLNTLASQQVNVVRRVKREEEISPEKAEHYLERIKADMMAAKDALDRQKEQQERLLRQRLGERKRKDLEVKSVNHKMQNSDLVRHLKENAAQTQGLLDPVAFVDAMLDLEQRQLDELNEVDNSFDEADTQELIDGYQQAVGETQSNIRIVKDQLMENLRQDGVPEEELARLAQQHNREVQQLEAAHEEEREIQNENFKAKLMARKKELEERLSQEQKEQQGLRAHENQMVQTLLMNQVSISDEERARILNEHERNLVQVENSLTLSKLRQKRMLEEAMTERRAKQMAKLVQKQEAEARTKLRGTDSDDEEEGDNSDVLEMVRRHEEQRLELLHGDSSDIEEEMESVRTKLMEERAAALKEQEEQIAAMLSGLQIEKAKELARIEEQQKAINNLKMNLMEDLNERGVLSDDRCQQIIQRHQEEQEGLVDRLNNQRSRQEQQLKDRLQARMRQREQQLTSTQQQQINEQLSQLAPKQKAQSQIRRAMLMNRHMFEMEQFRNRMAKECGQALEEAKRKFDLKKEEYLQEQELNFIGGLVRLGKFHKAELLEVLRLLFPLKSAEELQRVLEKIHSGQEEVELRRKAGDKEPLPEPDLSRSSLLGRTQTILRGMNTAVARFKELRNSPKRRSHRGNVMSLPVGGDAAGLTPIDRPDPLGQDSPPSFPDTSQGRAGDLPPLDSSHSRKKKKRKKSKRHRTPLMDEEEEEEEENPVINVRT